MFEDIIAKGIHEKIPLNPRETPFNPGALGSSRRRLGYVRGGPSNP